MTDLPTRIAPIEGIAEPLWKPTLLHAMAARFCSRARIDLSEGMDAAVAVWESEWDSDPEPRTMEMAMDAVDDELEHWCED